MDKLKDFNYINIKSEIEGDYMKTVYTSRVPKPCDWILNTLDTDAKKITYCKSF